jgi:hypothetical protein
MANVIREKCGKNMRKHGKLYEMNENMGTYG